MNEVELFKNITMLSLEQATVLPYLSYRLALDGVNVIRLELPVYGDPNRMVGENRFCGTVFAIYPDTIVSGLTEKDKE